MLQIRVCPRWTNPHIHITTGGEYPGTPGYRHLAIGLQLNGARTFLNHTPLVAYLRGDLSYPPFEDTDFYWQAGPLWLTTSEG